MKKSNNKIFKNLIKKINCLILFVLVLMSISLMSISLTVNAKSNSLSELTSATATKELSAPVSYSVEKVTNELFGNVSIKSSEYLYNLDDSADYIYVELNDGGYAVFLKETMELLEYSQQGKLNYPKNSSKYYGGPSLYMVKDDDCFVDVNSQEHLHISNDSAKTYASEVRETLISNYEERLISENVDFDYSLLEKEVATEARSNNISLDDQLVGEIPKLDTDNLIRITDGTYIPNYRYFLSDPKHGYNSTGTCGAVAAQLLLSYHNYYSDRRIVDHKYLNGGNSIPEHNPNLCKDPMKMTHETLGTKGQREDGIDYTDSYFHYVVENIPKSATTSQVKNGLNNILSERNNEITGTIKYSVKSLSFNSSGIISELDSGRPVILLMQNSLGGLNHYVVAYGYNNYTYPGSSESYLGYITHFGWGSNYLNIWVNSAWCYSYTSLKIEHTHNYYTVGQIPGTSRMEYKCRTCGHRTDAGLTMLDIDRYQERVVSIPQNDYSYKEINVSFDTAGNKLFQTFGSKDVKLYLFDSEYNQLKYDDDSGQGLNSLFYYNVEANKQYILRVKFYNSSNTGDVKVGITPASETYSKYEDIWTYNSTGVTFYFPATLNTTRVLTFTPTESGTYKFQTNYVFGSRVDTYLYVVDPTTTYQCLYDDDNAGDLQALITTDLVAGRTYFIVASTYNITTTSGSLSLDIKKIS